MPRPGLAHLVIMPVSSTYLPDPRLPDLGEGFTDPVQAADFPQTVLRFRNQRAAQTVGLGDLSPEEWIAHFGRFQPLPGNLPQPLAQRYHGHQFRVYNPDLGDGRGFTFAQLRQTGTGRLLDLGTKGSGQTPWSRQGDGRLTLKGGVREVLATAQLEALGVPTSQTFSLIETGEDLTRGDEPSPTRSAVMVRLSHGHIRFGTFQRLAYLDEPEAIRQLVAYCIAHYYPALAASPVPEVALLEAVIAQMATTTARWMAAGFVHGVLNTDNMNITGESFDYGPYRFLPRSDPNFVAAYFDSSGLYSFGRQPEAVFWNLQHLAGALSHTGVAQDGLIEALNGFGPAYRQALAAAVLARLGVMPRGDARDAHLVNCAFKALASGGDDLRWEPFFFDWFGADADRAMGGVRGGLYAGEGFAEFRTAMAEAQPDRPERLAAGYFQKPDPEELLIGEIETLWAAIADHDDWGPLEAKLQALEAARLSLRLDSPLAGGGPPTEPV